MKQTKTYSNAFTSIFVFLATHNADPKNAKVLASQRTRRTIPIDFDTTSLETDKRAADNSGVKKLAIQ
jgi:hypothetical protein